jgi:dolichol kinase
MKQEIIRKTIHILFGTLFLYLIYYYGTEISFLILLTIFIVGLFISILIKKGITIKYLVKIIKIVERDYEKHWPGKAALLFFMAAIILVYFFRQNPVIILGGLATTVYADSAAALIGKRFGKIKIGYNNTLEGTISCFLVCLLCIGFFFPIQQYNLIIIILPAILATIAEYLPINDNIAMPLATSTSIYLLLLVL